MSATNSKLVKRKNRDCYNFPACKKSEQMQLQTQQNHKQNKTHRNKKVFQYLANTSKGSKKHQITK